MGRLGYIYDPVFLLHKPGEYHPERPERLESIQSHLTQKGFFNRVEITQPNRATKEQLCLIHNESYVEKILSYEGEANIVLDIGDTVLSENSVDAAVKAAGAAVTAVELIFKEDIFDSVFAAVRPPGHHAERDHAKGFCVFNNLAIGVRYAINQRHARKVLIVDWDVHHGNGIQNAFYSDPDVLYLSAHQYPFFPGSGRNEERGSDQAEGYTMNYPLSVGQGDDKYINLVDQALQEIETFFVPDFICISAGFDAHHADPIGSMQITENGYYKLTELIARFAQKHCHGKILSMLEGGYHLPSLAESVYQHVVCLLKH